MSPSEVAPRDFRIVFFGATELGHRCCEDLIANGWNVVGIFSIPREFRISYSPAPVRNVTFRSFEDLGSRYGIRIEHVEGRLSDERHLQRIRAWKPDFGIAIGWYYMIPKAVRLLFPKGVAGIHASLLPKYRGGAPLVWAMIRGEQKTGVTFFYFDDGVDTGDIIAQREIEIGPVDTIRDVLERASMHSVDMLREVMPLVANGTAPRIPQNHEKASQYPQRSPADGRIDWSRSPEEIRNFIRAQTRPYPGAFTYIGGKKVILWDADVIAEPDES